MLKTKKLQVKVNQQIRVKCLKREEVETGHLCIMKSCIEPLHSFRYICAFISPVAT